jgi:hypothetical protein
VDAAEDSLTLPDATIESAGDASADVDPRYLLDGALRLCHDLAITDNRAWLVGVRRLGTVYLKTRALLVPSRMSPLMAWSVVVL